MPRIIFLFLFAPCISVAQQKLNFTLLGGFSNYSGDMQEKRFTLDQSHPSFGIGLSYQVIPKVMIRGGLQYGKVSADDKKSDNTLLKQRNLNFQSTIFEGSLAGEYSLFDIESYRRLTPYIFAGVALYRFNPYTYDEAGAKVFLHDLGTEGQGLPEYPDKKPYKLVQLGIPFGGGVRLRITDNVYIGYEIGLRKLFTDYLDDVSTTYADEAILASRRGAQAAAIAFRGDELKDLGLVYPPAGAVRGGKDFKDWYYFSGITLSIGIMNDSKKLFGKKEKRGSVDCPPGVL